MLYRSDNEIKDTSSEMLSSERLTDEMLQTREFKGMNRFMLVVILAALIPWLLGGYQVFGFNISGWSWVVPAVLAILVCIANVKDITFPIRTWTLWIGILFIYWFFGQDNPDVTQSLLQMLCPVAVGCAASTFRPDNLQLETVIQWITRLAWISWILLIMRLPMMLTGVIPTDTFLAAEMISLLLLGACYISFYGCGYRNYIYYYFSMLAIMFISLTRGPIVALLACLPLTSAPLATGKRILLCAVMIIVALAIFNTNRFQEKMFVSGSGELTDIRLGSPVLQTNSRSVIWEVLWDGVEKEPLLGNGFNYHRVTLLRWGFLSYAPHNDWLKLLYDMGITGVGVYLITIILQMLILIRIASRSSGAHQMIAYGAATAFIPYTLIMLTDNVVLYAQFFGNLHFTLIGIVYGTIHQGDNTEYV